MELIIVTDKTLCSIETQLFLIGKIRWSFRNNVSLFLVLILFWASVVIKLHIRNLQASFHQWQDYSSLKGLEMLLFNQGRWFRNADFCVSLNVFRSESQYFYPYSYRFADVLRIVTKNSCIGDLYSFNRAWRNFRNVEDEKKKEESIQRKPVLNRNWNTQSSYLTVCTC